MNQKYINIAIKEAKKATKRGNVPVGAVIVKKNKIIAKAHNKKNSNNISIYHAEIIAIIKACKKLHRWILNDCEIYVTMKPCQMCYYAIAETRIKKVYYLTESNYYHNLNSNANNVKYIKLNCNTKYLKIITDFFNNVRHSSKKCNSNTKIRHKLFPRK